MYKIDADAFERVRNLDGELINAQGEVRIVPASYFAATEQLERYKFGRNTGRYGFITEELIAWLTRELAGRKAIEIGSGTGDLARALGIPGTDSYMQERPEAKAHFALTGHRHTKYGANVERLDAAEAVAKHKPQVVIANWVTHKYRDDRQDAGGSIFGVVEEGIIANCESYIFIGNSQVHASKSIWSLPHERFEPPWLYSLTLNGSPNFIAIWGKRGPAERPG